MMCNPPQSHIFNCNINNATLCQVSCNQWLTRIPEWRGCINIFNIFRQKVLMNQKKSLICQALSRFIHCPRSHNTYYPLPNYSMLLHKSHNRSQPKWGGAGVAIPMPAIVNHSDVRCRSCNISKYGPALTDLS